MSCKRRTRASARMLFLAAFAPSVLETESLIQRLLFVPSSWVVGTASIKSLSLGERRARCSTGEQRARDQCPARTSMAVDQGIDCDSRLRGDPEALERWISSMGITLGPVVLEEKAQKGWGLRAARDLEAGDVLAVVPRTTCLGLVGGESSRAEDAWTGPPCVQALIDQVPEKYEDVRLGLLLLHERYKTNASKWTPYVNNLPRAFRGVPLSSFGAVEMRALQERELAAKIDERCRFLLDFVKDVLDPLDTGAGAPFGQRRLTFSDLAWATSAVSTRAFSQLGGGGGGQSSSSTLLVPYVDMLNSNFEESNVEVLAVWPSDNINVGSADEGDRLETAEIRLVATRPVTAGHSLEIFQDIPNEERLRKHGVVDVNRRSERCAFTFEKKILRAARMVAGILDEPFGAQFEADGLELWQQRILRELRLDGPDADLTIHLGGQTTGGRLPADERLLAALRTMFARSKKDLKGYDARRLGRYKEGQLSIYVEQRVLATVLGLSLIYVQSWPTTLEQDEVILYGRRVSPTLDEALRSPTASQVPANEDEASLDAMGSPMKGEEKIFENNGESKETIESQTREGLGADVHTREAGGAGCREKEGMQPERQGREADSPESQWRKSFMCDGQQVEKGPFTLETKPELRWEMVQAIGYRLAKKRTIFDVGLIARHELVRTGLSEGMLVGMKDWSVSVGPVAATQGIREDTISRAQDKCVHLEAVLHGLSRCAPCAGKCDVIVDATRSHFWRNEGKQCHVCSCLDA